MDLNQNDFNNWYLELVAFTFIFYEEEIRK